MNFSFLSPFFLIGLAALALPVIAHLISRKSGVMKKFPAVTFLLASRGDTAVRSRLKDMLLLLLRALVIALLVLVFARPSLFSFAPAGSDEKRSLAVVVDNSFSMGYGGNFSRALRIANEVIDTLPDGSFGLAAPLVAAPGEKLAVQRDRASIKKELADIALSATYADNEKRLADIYAMLSDSPLESREVILITDMQKNGWGGRTPGESWLRVVDVTQGKEQPNRAVTGVTAGREKESARLGVTVSNFSPEEAADLLATVRMGESEVKGHFDAGPHGSAAREFVLPADGTGSLTEWNGSAAITDDELKIDDTRYFVLSGRRTEGVLIIDGDPREDPRLSETYYLSSAGETISEITGADISVKDNDNFLREDPSGYDLIFLANVGEITPSVSEGLAGFVRKGGTLVIFPGERTIPESYNALLKDILPGDLLSVRDTRTFITSGENLLFTEEVRDRIGQVKVRRYFSISPGTGSETLLGTGTGEPFLLRKGVGAGSVYLFASTADTSWNDLPISTVFLPVVKELMDAGGLTGGRKKSYLAGEAAALDVPADGARVEVTGPGGERTAVDGARPVFRETFVPGIYTVLRDGEPVYSFPVNVDPSESDLSRIEIKSGGPDAPEGSGLVKVWSELWKYFLWGVAALFVTEAAARALFS